MALFHVGTIMVGSIGIGLILKGFGYSDEQAMSGIVIFVRNWGFVLTLIPFFWVLFTIWMELHYCWHSKRVTFVSGILLWAALIWFYILMAGRASSILYRMSYP